MGLMFPKPKETKKRKKHGESLPHQRDGTCFICSQLYGMGYQDNLQKHHIFGGPNRDYAEEDGLFVWLCIYHHTGGKDAVHTNKEMRLWLQRLGQEAYEDKLVAAGTPPEVARETFMQRYGRNYL